MRPERVTTETPLAESNPADQRTEGSHQRMVGCRLLTPWHPAGEVEVTELEAGTYAGRKTCLVKFITDHPMGYKAGSIGRYFVDELRQPTSNEKAER